MRVSIEDLRRATAVLLDNLEQSHGGQVELDPDFFWSIAPEQSYDVYQSPSDLTVGQISESMSHLEAIIDDPSRATGYALVWLADVLRACGHVPVR